MHSVTIIGDRAIDSHVNVYTEVVQQFRFSTKSNETSRVSNSRKSTLGKVYLHSFDAEFNGIDLESYFLRFRVDLDVLTRIEP